MLNWCIVGSGDVVNRLVKNSLNYKNESKVNTILTNDLKQFKKISKNINFDNIYLNTKKNIKKIQKDETINSIYIATPPDSHFFYIKKFCKFKKNIVCEKPLVKNLSELKKIKILIKKYKFNLLTCFYRRYLDRFIFIKNFLKKNSIGKLVYFNLRYFHNEKNHPTAKIIKNKIPWRFKRKISGGGNIVDMGIHCIDLIEFLMGEIKNIGSFNSNIKKIYDVEESSVVNFKLKNNIVGQGSWSSIAPCKQDYFEIYGLNGHIKFSLNYGGDENLYVYKNSKLKKINLPYNLPLHKMMMINFIKLLKRNNKYKVHYTAPNGLKTIELLNKIINY